MLINNNTSNFIPSTMIISNIKKVNLKILLF